VEYSKTSMPRKKKSEARLLPFHRAPKFQLYPFILSGYRRRMNCWQCIKSVFSIHNETGNIWTHLIGALLFIWHLLSNVGQYESGTQKTMFYLGMSACIVCYFTSSVYHTFSCHSQHLYETLLYCDFIGIVLTIGCVTTATVYFLMQCNPAVRNFYMICCGIFGLVLVFSIVGQLIYRQRTCLGKISQYLFIIFTAFGFIPLIHWTVAHGWNSEEVKASFQKVILAYLFLGIGFVLWKFHIPERWLIGKCDIWFSSHQLWHIMVMLGPAYFIFACEEAFMFYKNNRCLLDIS